MSEKVAKNRVLVNNIMNISLMKNVLHLCSYYIGNKLYSYLFSSLSERFNQYVYIPVKEPSFIGINKISQNNIKFIYDDFLKPYHRFFYGTKINSQFNRLNKFFERNNWDLSEVKLIHAHTLFSDGGTAYLLFKKYKIPYILSIRNTDINFFYKYAINYRHFSHEVLRSSSKIFFISYAYKDFLCDLLPGDLVEEIQHKFVVIPNGINEKFIYSPVNLKSNEKVKLFTSARLDKNKNIANVIDLVVKLREEGQDVVYKIAGEGPLSIKLKKYVEKKGVSNYVKFLGQISFDELIYQLDSSNIFIMVSFKETFGISYVEAMARGLPIIYTENQGIDGFFYQGEVGYSVDPTDLHAMSIAINKIMKNYSAISQNCINQASGFSWDSISNKYIEIYNNVVKG